MTRRGEAGWPSAGEAKPSRPGERKARRSCDEAGRLSAVGPSLSWEARRGGRRREALRVAVVEALVEALWCHRRCATAARARKRGEEPSW